jgi:predicted flap endonuclease-1-like 5' DNA nuclease
MFSVKGLPDNTGLIKPSTTTVAIAEIIFMITIAFLMGFGLAWMMRSEPMEILTDQLRISKYETREMENTITVHKESSTNWEKIAKEAEEKATNAQLTNDQLALRISDLTTQGDQLKIKNRELESKMQLLDGEMSSSKFRIRVLESEVADKNKAIGALTQELDEAGSKPKTEHRDWSDHPFVRPIEASSDEKDDLTEIKGIGPAFQKKLNLLDIFSFRQLSELDGEAVERLAELIEVFPERIHRDNWIGQATRLYMKKLGREV